MRKSKIMLAVRTARRERQFWRAVQAAPSTVREDLLAAHRRSLPR